MCPCLISKYSLLIYDVKKLIDDLKPKSSYGHHVISIKLIEVIKICLG